VRFDGILAAADDDRIGLFELRIPLTEPASLLGSTGRAVFGIKKQHNSFTFDSSRECFLPSLPDKLNAGAFLPSRVFTDATPPPFHHAGGELQPRQNPKTNGQNATYVLMDLACSFGSAQYQAASLFTLFPTRRS
jgi:hypothetical protein